MHPNETLHNENSFPNNNTDPDPCTASLTNRYLLFTIFTMSVLVIGVVGNSLTILVILYSRKLRAMFAYRLVMSLAIADLGFQLFAAPLKISMFLHNSSFCHSLQLCSMYHNADLLFTIPALLHLLVIAIDRSTAISKPYLHAAYFTKSKANIVILFLWLYSSLWTGVGNVPWSSKSKTATIHPTPRQRVCYSANLPYFIATISVIYIVPMTITSVLYSVIVVIAKKQAGAMKKMVYNSQKLARERFHKTFKTVFLVFITYTLCWIPHFIYVFMTIWASEALNNWFQKSPLSFDIVTTTISDVLPTLQGCLNPFIYFLSSVHFRKTLRSIFYKTPHEAKLTMTINTRSFRSDRRSTAFDKLMNEKTAEDSL